MKEELKKIAKNVVNNGSDILRSETEKLRENAIEIIDKRIDKKKWSGYDSIPSGIAEDTVVPGCLVLEGGSFRGLYTSGVLDVFMENGINIQTTIGTSAGALNGYNYVAGEIGRSAKINLGYRHDIRYMGPVSAYQSRGVVGLNFIINEIESDLPFNHERFNDPKRRFLVTVTNCETGQCVYCEKGVTPEFNKAVQASASMPYVSNMVDVDGMPCLDGGCTVKIPYQWAIDNGYEKILVIKTRPQGFRHPKEENDLANTAEVLYRNYPLLNETLKRQNIDYNHALDELDKLESEGRLMTMAPSGSIQVSHLEGDMEKLGALYLLGRCDAMLMLPKVKAYFGIE